MIQPGNYKARATEGALGRTKDGNPQIAVSFALTEEGPSQGESLAWYGYFGPKPETAERTIESLRHCGWKGDDLTDLAGISDNEVTVVVELNEYQGNITARVAWVNAGDGLRMKSRMTDGDAKAFAEKMRGTVVALRQKSGAAAAAPSAQPKQRPPTQTAARTVPPELERGDDNIPF